jgi:acetyltransferase-like isoleucine patch superfamily enzyme
VILSNVRLDKRPVRIKLVSPVGRLDPGYVDTGMEKLGGILGDGCEVGCNSVLNPGTILGRGCFVAPLSVVKGSHEAGARIG